MNKKVIYAGILLAVVAIGVGIYFAYTKKPASTGAISTPAPVSENSGRIKILPPSQVPISSSTEVSILNFEFNPTQLIVRVGSTVTWTNNDKVIHTVTSDVGSEMNSGPIKPGSTYSHVFDSAGTFIYHCTIHPNMIGNITVI